MFSSINTEYDKVFQILHPSIKKAGLELYIKRLDIPDNIAGGNKSYKLKYNLLEAKIQNKDTILTFGGAYSNHIVATAASCRKAQLKCIGIIRGDKQLHLNPSLNFAHEQGMKLHFVSRDVYRNKENKDFIDSLKEMFGDFYLIPEGGANTLGVKGCSEIINSNEIFCNYISVACGTGATLAGIINSLSKEQKGIGIAVLNAKEYLEKNVLNYTSDKRENQFEIIDRYYFGGYAKKSQELEDFISQFNAETGIEIEPIYTGKLMFALMDLIKTNFFNEGKKIMAIHTGGLQYLKLK